MIVTNRLSKLHLRALDIVVDEFCFIGDLMVVVRVTLLTLHWEHNFACISSVNTVLWEMVFDLLQKDTCQRGGGSSRDLSIAMIDRFLIIA